VARCFVTRELPGPALDRLRQEHEVEVWPGRLPPPAHELHVHTADKHGLLSLLTDKVDGALLAASPHLQVISNYAVGVDNIDLEAAHARRISVGNTPDVLTEATADLTFALLLAAARKLTEAVDAARDDWVTWEPGRWLGAEVHGATLGIIGMGRIGQAVARRASGFEMTVVSVGRNLDHVHDLLERSDFVTLHCPLTPDTRHLIDANALASMKPTAILINTARGPIVDQRALIDALRMGTIAGAALDVTDPEPPAPNDPVLTAPNLIVAPHIGSATRAAREQMANLAVDNLLAGLAGEPLPHEVTAT
jgi:glyoxylate reductase